MIYIANALSAKMIEDKKEIVKAKLSRLRAKYEIKYTHDGKFVSCIGHKDLASLVTEQIGVEIPVNRQDITLKEGDILYIAQYTGPRLPEGTTELPEGAVVEWFRVEYTKTNALSYAQKMEIIDLISDYGQACVALDSWGNGNPRDEMKKIYKKLGLNYY